MFFFHILLKIIAEQLRSTHMFIIKVLTVRVHNCSTKNVKNIFAESNFDSQCQGIFVAMKRCSLYDLGSLLQFQLNRDRGYRYLWAEQTLFNYFDHGYLYEEKSMTDSFSHFWSKIFDGHVHYSSVPTYDQGFHAKK